MAQRTKEEVRKTMQAIRSQNTKIEVMVGRALWRKGYRYRKNNRSVYGTPDFTFKRLKLAIFCDSDFWHGKDWDVLKTKLKTNREFWIKKIERNIARDKKVNRELKKQGWVVLRFWETDIEKRLASVVSAIEVTIIFLGKCCDDRKTLRAQYNKLREKTNVEKFLRRIGKKEAHIIQSVPHLYVAVDGLVDDGGDGGVERQ